MQVGVSVKYGIKYAHRSCVRVHGELADEANIWSEPKNLRGFNSKSVAEEYAKTMECEMYGEYTYRVYEIDE